MSEENKTVELKEEDLEKVSGGQYSYNVTSKVFWKCPSCGNRDHSQLRAQDYNMKRLECQICWHEGPVDEFYA